MANTKQWYVYIGLSLGACIFSVILSMAYTWIAWRIIVLYGDITYSPFIAVVLYIIISTLIIFFFLKKKWRLFSIAFFVSNSIMTFIIFTVINSLLWL